MININSRIGVSPRGKGWGVRQLITTPARFFLFSNNIKNKANQAGPVTPSPVR